MSAYALNLVSSGNHRYYNSRIGAVLFHPPSLPFPLPLSLPFTLPLSLPFTLPFPLPFSLPSSLSLPPFLSLSSTHTHTFFHSLSHSHALIVLLSTALTHADPLINFQHPATHANLGCGVMPPAASVRTIKLRRFGVVQSLFTLFIMRAPCKLL